MSENNNHTDSMDNAEEIIERFGGIRPMATKMNVPVTTVQGWKKRNVIPANRRREVIQAARSNNIEISDLIAGVANENRAQAAEQRPMIAAPSYTPADDVADEAEDFIVAADDSDDSFDDDQDDNEEYSFSSKVREAARSSDDETEQRHREAVMTAQSRAPQEAGLDMSNEEMIRRMKEAQSMTFNRSAWFTVGLVAFVVVIAAVMLWPSTQQIEKNAQDITNLQGQVNGLEKKHSFLDKIIPGDMQDRLTQMQEQAQTIQESVAGLSAKVETMAADVMDPNATMGERFQRIEQHAAELGAPVQLTALLHKVEEMQQTVAGQQQLSGIIASLNEMIGSTQAQGGDIDTALQQAQQQDGALGETLQGVNGEDLKAAALLVGLAQFRSTMNRSAPFTEDLALMQKLLGDKDPELNTALERLAPQAARGVLTPEGLQDQFKGLAGDIVVSSLKGEDVSVQEKAKARLNEILQVEKDGQLITGTDTQAKVARAQKMLDAGDIQGAIAELQSLEGPAAQTAEPFMSEAQNTLLAQQAQSLLTSRVVGDLESAVSGGSSVSVQQLIREVKQMANQRHVIRDEASGFVILEPKPKLVP